MQTLRKLGQTLKSAPAQILFTVTMLHAGLAQAALPKIDLTQDAAGGKDLNDTAANAGGLVDSGISLSILIAGLIGVILTIVSLYTIWKAGKDEREKPTSAIIGIVVGGALLAITTIMWLSRNSLFK
ncbi:DUF6750 family protein [Castellaniella sp.]|uniref:DUF6750 family protein n=1 Tax=Castellaniella sp. TaxID=1955812 RepID=UPI002AFF9FE1|nr:DUF6750 family protein [Castellaniella sp.]